MPHGGKGVTGILLAGARTTSDNACKLQLVQRTIDAVLMEAKFASVPESHA